MTIKRQQSKRLNGSETFKNTGSKSFSVLEFWQYAFSSLNSNIVRGALAEFLVVSAIKGKDQINIRDPWTDYDLLTEDGLRIEVKCCSYLQDWEQKRLSNINFTGLKARYLYGEQPNYYDKDAAKRFKADIYVLALLKHQDPATLDIFNLDHWCFYVLTRQQVEGISGNGNSISLKKLEQNNIQSVHFAQLKETLNKLKNS